jgi:hypothetical protein
VGLEAAEALAPQADPNGCGRIVGFSDTAGCRREASPRKSINRKLVACHFLTDGRAFFGSAKDVDGDGQLDLVIANGATDDVAVMFRLRRASRGSGRRAPEGAGLSP